MQHQRPARSTFDFLDGWPAPRASYAQIQVSRPSGKPYLTEFYECSACTVVFRRPGRLARLGSPIKRWASDVEPRSLRERHGFVVVQKDTDESVT